MITAPFDRFVRPARGYSQIWRIILGAVLIVLGYLGGIALIFLVAFLILGGPETMRLAQAMADTSGTRETILLLFSFLGALLAPMAVVRLLHKRAAGTLFGPLPQLIRDFAWAAAVILVISTLVLLGWAFWFDAIPNLAPSRWLLLLPLIVPGLLIQTLAEETVFRGYLTQQLGARFNSPIAWMLGPALAFGALHIDPTTMGPNTWLVAGSTVLFALIATDLVRVTGSLGAAWGFHFANNFIAIAILSTKGSISGTSLFLTPYESNDPLVFPILMLVDLVVMFISWLILRRILEP